MKQGPLTQNFAKKLYIFLLPKFLELFFTPKNTPPRLRNSKISLKIIFFGTPCIYIQLPLYFSSLSILKLCYDHVEQNFKRLID